MAWGPAITGFTNLWSGNQEVFGLSRRACQFGSASPQLWSLTLRRCLSGRCEEWTGQKLGARRLAEKMRDDLLYMEIKRLVRLVLASCLVPNLSIHTADHIRGGSPWSRGPKWPHPPPRAPPTQYQTIYQDSIKKTHISEKLKLSIPLMFKHRCRLNKRVFDITAHVDTSLMIASRIRGAHIMSSKCPRNIRDACIWLRVIREMVMIGFSHPTPPTRIGRV